MVYFYKSQPSEDVSPHWLITGKDKFENDLLIKYGYRELQYYWFHADKYSSGHIYLQLRPDEKSLQDVPREVISDCLQLCKSESIQGNKLQQCTIIVTPWHNLRKSGYMKPGEVSFKRMKDVQKMECFARDNAVLNRLKKTRIEVTEEVEKLLHEAKKSKDGEFFINFLETNRERLLKEEAERLAMKKQKKKKKKLLDEDQESSPDLDVE
ncbi:protein JLP2 [Kluyveromyces marxianus]|uniref:Protein JLP2 n=1 Tax=Kluyveromyces marxianus TaxID=4911 RepID=A0ABX6EU01_KLUMA|nr:protein JLP2 [Kluyveromyces marxianus]BAP71577.1 protein JLP2 [Kluyveromyces marxianus]